MVTAIGMVIGTGVIAGGVMDIATAVGTKH
jgi:hypothetical protein